ncbi:hypothetical protein UlMin_008140 [Ulmus minor]
MGFLKQSSLLLPLCFFLVSGIFPFLAISINNTKLVYKGCADQKFPDPNGIYSQNLKSLYDSLFSQFVQKPFATTTAGQGQNAITGWFQCRGDLATNQCFDYVSKIPEMANNLCPNAISARVYGSSLFYTGTYQFVYVLAQCEGDLGADDCGDCVKNAAQRAVSECGFGIVLTFFRKSLREPPSLYSICY